MPALNSYIHHLATLLVIYSQTHHSKADHDEDLKQAILGLIREFNRAQSEKRAPVWEPSADFRLFLTRTSAIKKLPTLFHEFVRQYAISQAGVGLHAYLLALQDSGRLPVTIKNYRSDIGQFLTFHSNKSLDAIVQKSEVIRFVEFEKNRGSSETTIRRKLVSVGQFCNWLSENGWISSPAWTSTTPTAFTDLLKNTQVVSSLINTPFKHQEESETVEGTHGRLPVWTLPLQRVDVSRYLPNVGTISTSTAPLKKSIFSQIKLFSKNTPMLGYLNLAMGLIFLATTGFLGYRQFFSEAESPLAFPTSLTRPNRSLSFQGRLTNTDRTPITALTPMRFRLYDSGPSGGSGTLLWDSTSCNIDPDQDGIFSTTLGDSCGAEISSDVFTENSNVWLEVQVNSEILNPRQSIKTVAYALNSETLQGYPASASAVESTVLVMRSDGKVVFGNANPILEATGDSFAITAKTLTLETSSGSNGNVIINPDGTGQTLINSNTLIEGYLSAPGATLSATYAGGRALTLKAGPSATGDIMQWQTSVGTPLGVIDKSGNIGIGTTVARASLEIAGTASSSGTLTFKGTTDPKIDILNGENFGIRTSVGGDIGLSEKFTVLNTGAVGVNTSAPTANLDVANTANGYAIRAWRNLESGGLTGLGFSTHATGQFTKGAVFFEGGTGTYGRGRLVLANDVANDSGTVTVSDAKLTVSQTGGITIGSAYYTTNTADGNLLVAGNVGIGTTSTRAQLDIAGSASSSGVLTFRGTTDPKINILNGESFGIQTSVGGDVGLAERFTILNNGYVGINSTSPSQQLEVGGNVEIANYLYFANGATDYLRFDGSDFRLSNDFLPSANNTYALGTNASRWSAIYGTAIYQGANQVCDTSGNCSSVGNLWQYANGGISPATPYTSIADFYIGGDSTASAKFAFLNVNSGTPTASVSAGTAGATFLAANGNISTTARQNLTLGNSATYNTTGNILLNPNGTGNVGIGTTNPSSPLQVHGPSTGLVDILKISKAGGSTSYMSVFSNTSNSSNFDPSFLGFHGSGGSAALQFIGGMDAGNDSSGNSPLVSFQARRGGVSGSAVVSRDLFDFNNYGTSVMRINVSGYVGIGSTSPTAKLDIAGSASTSGTLAFRGTTDPKIDILNGENFSIRTSVGGDVGLTERLTILSNGNIGIGTTSPGSDMEIYKGAAGQNPTLIINAQGPGGVTSGINLKASTNNALITYNSWSPNLILQNNFTSSDNSVGYISFNTKGSTTSKMVILQNGNVGIGTTAPTALLDITGSASSSGTLAFRGTTDPKIDILNGEAFGIRTSVGGDGGLTERFTILNNGNVGIGTNNPDDLLHVMNSDIRLSNGYGLTVKPNFADERNIIKSIDKTNKVDIQIGQSSTALIENVLILPGNNGNVGINTTSPSQLLDIQGAIRLGAASANNVLHTTSGSAPTGNLYWGNRTICDSSGNCSSVGNLWQYLNGGISPSAPYTNVADFYIGGNATASAKFGLINVNSGTPTATIAGNLALAVPTGSTPTTKLNIYNGGTFGIRTSVGGDAGLAERLTILNNGNVGIGTTNPAYKLSLAGTSSPGDRKVGINGTQVVYLPDQTSFTGSLIVGDGGSNLNHSINIDGYNNSIFGLGSGSALTSGSGNSVLGTNALSAANTGLDNVAVGYNTLNAITWSSNNTAVGANAGRILTDGDQNTLLGSQTGYNLTDGADNIFVGYQAGWGITTGFGNVVVGDTADAGSGASGFNVSLGYAAGYNATGGSNNVMLGSLAGSNIGGSNNILVGYKAGDALTSGTNNIAIGYDIDLPSNTGSNQLSIGNLIFGTGLNGTGTTISTGNIGIGTTAPSQKLDVNGGIRLGTAGAGNVLNTSAGSAPTGNLYWGDRTVCDSGGSCGTSGIYSNWTVNASNGTINPNNNTLDVLFGGTASSSAKFAFLNVNSGIPTASIAGNLALAAPTGANPATKLNVYNGGSFGIQTSVGGDVGLAERLTILNNGNVGIGTTIPESSLDVRSTTNASIKIKGTNGQGGGIGLEIDNTTTTTGRKYQVVNYDNGDFVFRNTAGAGNDFVRFNDSNNLILLEDGGNVGIGTTSPSQKLHVDGSARITGALYDSSNSAGSSGYLLTSTGSGTAWGSVSSVLDGTYFKQGGNSYGSTGIIGTNDNNGLFFRTNNSNKMFLNTDGSLAIYENGGSTEFLKLGHDGSVGWIGTEQGGPGSNTPLVFRTAYFDRMYISTAGNVGIGTTSPSQKLHVDGSARITGALYDSSNSAGSSGSILTSTGSGTAWGSVSSIMDGTYFKQGGNSYGALATLGTNDSYGLAFETNNTERVRIDTSGNVGIGTTSPGAKLEVVGRSRFDSGASFSAIDTGWSSSSGYSTGNWGVRIGANNNVGIVQAAENSTAFPLVLNPYGGNVGIGTTTPEAKLDIAGGSVRLDNQQELSLENTGGLVSGQIFVDSSNHLNVVNQGGAIIFKTPGTAEMVRFTGGNVGIGTTSPTTKLDIDGQIRIRGGSPASGRVLVGDASGVGTWTDPSTLPAGSVSFTNITSGTNTTAAMLVGTGASLGFTGSGTINASTLQSATWASPLAIGNTTASTGRFTTLEATSTGNALTLSGAGTNIAFTGAGPAQITTASNQHLALMPAGTGNVGIGTTSPDAALQVNGNIHIGTDSSKGIISYTTNTLNFNPIGNIQLALGNNVATLGSWGGDQTINAASGGAGNSNRAGINLVLGSGQSTGNGAPGGFIFNTTPAGVSGTQANPYAEVMRITGAGNVGIGTTSPNTKLHLLGDLTITGGIRPATDGTTALQLQKANGTSVLDVDTTNSNVLVSGKLIANGFVIDKTNQDMLISRHTGGEVAFRSQTTNGRSQIILSPNGAPTYSRARMMFGLTDIIADPTNVENMTFAARGDTNEYWISTEAIGTGTARPIVFKRYQQGASPSTIDIMRLMTDGNVGIGTTTVPDLLTVRTTTNDVGITLAGASSGVSPTYKLADSGGTVHARIGIAGAAGNLVTNASINDLVFRNNAKNIHFTTDNGTSTSLFVGSNGRVGIGTTSPSYAFQANGPVDTNIISAQVTSSNRKIGLAVGDSRVGLHLRNDGTSHMGISSDGSDIFFGNASSSESPDNWGADLMTIKNGGNVGIGTTGPTQKLDVNGNVILSATSPYLYFENTNNYLLSSSDNLISKIAGSYYFRDTNSYDRLSILSTGDTTINNASNGNIATFKNSGNVGIGTTSPTAKLTIQASSSAASLGSELLITTEDRDFSSSSGNWSGTNWTIGSGVATHTAGANSFIHTLTPTATRTYQILATINTTTAGKIYAQFGAASGSSVGTTVGTLTQHSWVITATDTTSLRFIPDGAWAGTIDDVSVKEITQSSAIASLLDSNAYPFLEFRGLTSSGDSENIALGRNSIMSNITGIRNTSLGSRTLEYNTTGNSNVAIGYRTLRLNTTGSGNSAVGQYSLLYNTTGSNNSALGIAALSYNTTGSGNTASGLNALLQNTSGDFNVALGYTAMQLNTTGSNNAAVGLRALEKNTTGSMNVALGYWAGRFQADGATSLSNPENSVYIGAGSRGYDDNDDNSIVIGYNAIGLGANTVVLGNDSITTTALKGNVGIGTTSPSALIHGIKTTEQLRLGYDASNYYSTTVSSAGGVTFDAVGISSGFTFSDYVGMAGSGLELSSTTSFSKSSGSGSFSFSTNTGNKGIEFVNSGATTGTDSGFDYSSGVTTGRGMSITANSLTSGSGIYASSSSLTSGSLMNLVVTGSGAASSSQKVLNISNSGTNGTTETTYGAYVTNTRTGEGGDTNVAGYFSASGAASNYGLIVASGNMGIGTTAPGAMLQLGTAASTLGTLRLTGNTSGYTQIQPSAAAGSWTMTLPTGTGSNGQQLTTNGSGVTSWTAANSLRTTKNILGTMDASIALDTLVNAQVYRFNYKPGMGTGDSETEYVGIMADEAPWAMHYDGTIVNPVNTLGYAILGVQALNQKNTQLENSLNQVNAMLADYPDLSIDQFGALEVFEADNATYQVVDSTTATPINDRFAAFTRTITAIVEAGLTRTRELVVTGRAQIADLSVSNLSINGQGLRDYIVAVIQENQATNSVIVEVSPTPAPVATATESAWLAEVFQREPATGEPMVEDLSVTDLLTTQSIEATSVITEGLSVTGQTQLGSLLVSENASVAGVMTVSELGATSARIDALEAGIAQLESVKATTAEFANATVSGTLYAQTIADLDKQIAQLLEEPTLLEVFTGAIPQPQTDYTQLYQAIGSITTTASQAAELDQSIGDLGLIDSDVILTADAGFIDRYFKINGIAYVADKLGVGNALAVGNKLEITDSYLSFSADPANPDSDPFFMIQPSGKGLLAMMGDLLLLDGSGQVTINGNLRVAGNITVEGSLLTNVLEPIEAGGTLSLNLGQTALGEDATLSGDLASPSARFEVLGFGGTPVATVSAQGKASFTGLSLGRDLLERPQVAGVATQSSELTQEATQTTGRAILPAGNRELTINNPNVRADSLIYLTPLGSTNNQVLYVKQVSAPDQETEAALATQSGVLAPTRSFTIGLDAPALTDISFTWWIVN